MERRVCIVFAYRNHRFEQWFEKAYADEQDIGTLFAILSCGLTTATKARG
jgi:hypothetical protein